MDFFIRILFFLLIIDHTCILALKEFVDLSIKKSNRFKKKNVIALVPKVSNSEREIYFLFFLNKNYMG